MSEISGARLDAPGLRGWAHDAVGHLITHTDEINRLNVFPVADSDTGTNMLFTMRSAVVWADDRAGEDAFTGVAGVAAALAEGALHGARGNSGVILSQILRGLAEVTAGRGLAEIDGPVLAEALRRAEGLVVASMGQAVPGTIVSVLQAAATAAENAVGAGADVASGAGADLASGAGADLASVVGSAAEAAATALARTTDQLDVLAEAGVVDAGGRGLLVLLDAMTATLTGAAPRRENYQPAGTQSDPVTGPATPQFEVMYLLSECRQDGAARLRGLLDGLGDSVAIGDAGAGRYSVHVHTDDAGGAVEAGLSVGALSRIQITALAGGHPSAHRARDRAVLAVVDGDGAAELFAGEGARVLRADHLAPISAQQLLRALVEADAEQVMLLPNGYIAAEELVAGCTAATGWGIDVVPVPAGSMVQGLAALAVHDAGRQTVDDGYTMARAAAAARHGSVRVATESALTWAGACKAGDGLGITGDEVLIVAHDIGSAASGLVDLLLASGGELVTVLIGAGVDEAVGEQVRRHVHERHLGAEVTCYRTGHTGDALLIGVE